MIWKRFKDRVRYKARSFSIILNFPPVSAAVNYLQKIDNVVTLQDSIEQQMNALISINLIGNSHSL